MRNRNLLLSLAVILAAVVISAPALACFSIVAGRKASTDGYVLIGHNEDDGAPQVVNHHKVGRKNWPRGSQVTLRNGGKLEQVPTTWAYIWSEMPGMLFSDSYINEWGVAITSDNCPSREDKGEITDGGIGYMLRRLLAQRARTAREGVLLAGRLVERFGYIDSGRTYIICDPREGWLFSVVKGKHWLAHRVPDDQVAMIPNTYTTGVVDLADKADYLASADIVEYAVARGWYDPDKDGPFNFAKTYANPDIANNPSNVGRHWSALQYVTDAYANTRRNLPFSVKPKHKLSPADLMRILRHDESSDEPSSSSGTTTRSLKGWPICSVATQTSFVAQLRKDRPLDLGIVYHVCLANPRTSVYIPFHFATRAFPSGWAGQSVRPDQQQYEARVGGPFKADSAEAFWTFSNFRDKVGEEGLARTKRAALKAEADAAAIQADIERAAARAYRSDADVAAAILENYSAGVYLKALDAMNEIVNSN